MKKVSILIFFLITRIIFGNCQPPLQVTSFNGNPNTKPVAGDDPEMEGWIFTASEAARVHRDYSLKDLRLINDNTKYSWLHMNEFMPSATVARKGDISKFFSAPHAEIGKIKVTNSTEALTLEEYIKHSALQGIIVIHKGKIVYERYPRMRANDKHIHFSVTKTFAGTGIALLEQDKKINLEDSVGKYLPELNKSDWGKVKIVDVLNMASGMNPQFDDPGARTDTSNLYFQFESALGIQIKTTATAHGVWNALNKMHQTKAAGTVFEYGGHNTVILALLIERITGKTFSEFISERIWTKIGAEAEAYLSLSPEGIAVASAAMSSTLRDLGRYGLLFTPSWSKVSNEKIISDASLYRMQKGLNVDKKAYDKGAFGKRMIRELGERPSHNAYQWDFVMDDGDFFKTGLNGQGLYISPSKDLVIACFSHGDYEPGVSVAYLSRAIAKSFLLVNK